MGCESLTVRFRSVATRGPGRLFGPSERVSAPDPLRFTKSWGEPIPLAEKSALTSADEFVVTTAFVEHEVTAGSSVTYTLRAVLR
jgi:hypothetical protein